MHSVSRSVHPNSPSARHGHCTLGMGSIARRNTQNKRTEPGAAQHPPSNNDSPKLIEIRKGSVQPCPPFVSHGEGSCRDAAQRQAGTQAEGWGGVRVGGPHTAVPTSPCPHPIGSRTQQGCRVSAPHTCCCIHSLEQVPSCIRLKLTQGFKGKLSVGYCSASVSLFG